jgi:DNA-binding transcriptional MerR regulator
MKIKEVSKLTGLTEKTIRFYEDKGLISPAKEEVNGREFRSYCDKDIEFLNIIADLRKLDFSISDIIIMRDTPENIQNILKEYSVRTSEDLAFKTNMLQRLMQINYKDISKLEDLVEQLKELSKDRVLPAADIELEFFKIDGITKEDLKSEIFKYEERLSIKFKSKIRNTTILFVLTLMLYIILTVFIWNITYYLGYIQSFQNDIGWRKLLIPAFALLLLAFIYAFVKNIKFINKLNQAASADKALRICRYSIFILLLCFTIGIVVSIQSLENLKKFKIDTGREVVHEWYPIYRMNDYVNKYLDSPENYKELIENGLYVNQTCYNFSMSGYSDVLNTKMMDLLIFCYDPLFKEFTNPEGAANKDKIAQMLKNINKELKELFTELAEKSDAQRADLTRHDLTEAKEFRQNINSMVDKYCTQSESFIGRQRP